LENARPEDFQNLAEHIKIEKQELEKYLHWDSGHYTRNCIRRTDEFELIALCWEAKQETPIHCHGGEECWVYVVDGELEEFKYDKSNFDSEKEKTKMSLGEYQISYMEDSQGYHSLSNLSDNKAISLHLYHKPIQSCRVYNKEDKSFNWVEMSDYSFEGRLLQEA
tara:strand:+ start:9110 stop:9604 length:495 start_codon:yes stop_codon:yes gene_type:complete